MIQAGHLITYFPEEAQAAVWADGPDVPIAGSVMPVCEVVAADGGYRISGNSPFASGVDHAKWVFVSGMVAGDGPPRVTYFLVPAGSYEIVDTWHTVGMRGTGSKTIATDDVFVPAAHTLWLGDLLEGDPTQAKTGGAGIYGLPFASYAPVGFAATMLGAAEGALEGVRESLGKKRTPTGVAVADIAGIQRRVADVAVELDSAHLLLRRSIDAATEGFPSLERRARTLRDAAYAAGLITGAVDAMLGMIGTAGFASSNSLQRTWRDVRFAACHISLNREGNSAHWGRIALGGEGPPALAIY
jgi:3-hydroxy-9,10-secoandrosta-1,3,5(10)-triene-9,17-dione monooxygenase